MSDFNMESLRRRGFKTDLPQTPSSGSFIEQNPLGQPITDSIFGLNYMQTPLPVPMNRDHYGLTLFTRPQLNLQSANLADNRKFLQLLGDDELNILRAIRCYLDPRLQFYSNTVDYGGNNMGVNCRLVDPYLPFIPLLTNHLVSLSGMPDKLSPVYQTPQGQYREVQSMVDGTNLFYGAYNISATFRNSKGNPIIKIFDFWEDYASLVFEGKLVQYTDVMLGGLLDYQTRIYRFTLDPSKRYVTGMACSGVSFPISNPKAQQYDYNMDKPYNDANNQLTIQFESNGVWWDDDIIIWAMNAVVGAFNPSMRTARSRASDMFKIPVDLLEYFNCRAYPYIDASTRSLEWWVPRTYYNAIQKEAVAAIEMMLDNYTGTERRNLTSELEAPTVGVLST